MTNRLLPFLILMLVACGGAKPVAHSEPGPDGGTSNSGSDRRAEVMRLFMEATQARLQGQLPKA